MASIITQYSITDYCKMGYELIVDGILLGKSNTLSRVVKEKMGDYLPETTAKVSRLFMSAIPFIVTSLTPALGIVGSIPLFAGRIVSLIKAVDEESKTKKIKKIFISAACFAIKSKAVIISQVGLALLQGTPLPQVQIPVLLFSGLTLFTQQVLSQTGLSEDLKNMGGEVKNMIDTFMNEKTSVAVS